MRSSNALREGWLPGSQRGEQIENPDRKRRFDFIRPALSADPAVRAGLFRSLNDVGDRAHEPWALRAEHSVRFLAPSLELLEEIQRTGDIFFPKGWIDASLDGHSSARAAAVVREFLKARPDYPHRLRGKILQSADMLFRAAEIVAGE